MPSTLPWNPRTVVWEITLECNLRCLHCGSRAGLARDAELSTAECLDVVQQLADAGTELITLSGGEPTRRDDWDTIAKAIAAHGIYVNMVSNGVYGSPERAQEIARRAKASGMCNVGISIDGPEAVHDRIRGKGNFARSMQAVAAYVAEGLSVGFMFTVHRDNFNTLRETYRLAHQAGARMFRVQMAKPMGAMQDWRSLIISPTQMVELLAVLAELKKQGPLELRVGDSLGYYSPHDHLLRGRSWRQRKESWGGCQAGLNAIGIEANGNVKGCLSLQAKLDNGFSFVEGNLRTQSLDAIWNAPGAFSYNRQFQLSSLTGACARCSQKTVCRGGARCVAAATTGALGEDRWCYLAVTQGQKRSLGGNALAAAAALLLGVSACGPNAEPDTLDASQQEVTDQAQTDQSELPPGDVQPDSIDCSGVCCNCDYGILPDEVAAACCGIPDPCEGVCCDCDYGEPPPAECCPQPVDPCEGVCCDCDYGEPPPAECCPQPVDPCEGVCCDCDYGEPPPPSAAHNRSIPVKAYAATATTASHRLPSAAPSRRL
ncbi:MAG: radical SAM protein [Myxococcota bacterium]|jgi:MoaA/NifB/PqqE/SkfB family radical SAM enzyme|nr:radical SAM protein [Myxococcota bacterium]